MDLNLLLHAVLTTLTQELALVLMSHVALMVPGLFRFLSVTVTLDIVKSLRMAEKSVKVKLNLFKKYCDNLLLCL